MDHAELTSCIKALKMPSVLEHFAEEEAPTDTGNDDLSRPEAHDTEAPEALDDTSGGQRADGRLTHAATGG